MTWILGMIAFGMLAHFRPSSGTLQPTLYWKFNTMTPDRFVKESNSSTKNRGLLLPGTEIVMDSSWVGATFTGNRSGIIVDNITDTCFLAPQTCNFGLSVSFHIKWLSNAAFVNNESLMSSANFSILHQAGGDLLISLWDGKNEWQMTHTRNTSEYGWLCYIVTWDHKSLRFYVNGKLKSEVKSNNTKIQLNNGIYNQRSVYSLGGKALLGRLAIGNTATKELMESGLRMLLDDLKIWDFPLISNVTKRECQRDTGYQLTVIEGKENKKADQSDYKYRDQAYTSIQFSNKALHGFTFSSTTVTDLNGCIYKCMENKNQCMSFNIGIISNRNEYVCQLNKASRAHFPQNIVDKYDYFYYDVYWEP